MTSQSSAANRIVYILHQRKEYVTLAEFSSEDLNFSSEKPEDHGDGLSASVVAWNSDVDEVQRTVGVAKSDGWNIDIRCFDKSLLIRSWVSDDQKSWLLESLREKLVKFMLHCC